MPSAPRDVAQIRLDNAMRLFEEFVSATVKHPDAATLRGLERRFAEKLQIQPSYWSQIKGRSRQIGERLARQFEQLCHKPPGWMDIDHGAAPGPAPLTSMAAAMGHVAPPPPEPSPSLPADDDERFIVGLVLTYYRRHPQRAAMLAALLAGLIDTLWRRRARLLRARRPATTTGGGWTDRPLPCCCPEGRQPLSRGHGQRRDHE